MVNETRTCDYAHCKAWEDVQLSAGWALQPHYKNFGKLLAFNIDHWLRYHNNVAA